MYDLTELVTAARTNDPRTVAALSDRFAAARFHLPLTSLKGVKNRPETALEMGSILPLHRLRLDTGRTAIPLFTNLELCRECAKKLSWKTDGKAIKTLPVPGSIALSYLKELLLSPEVDRAILNPLSEGALHLARTEVEAFLSGERLRTLWLYARNGGLIRPVEIEGGSLLGAILGVAGLAISGEEPTSLEEAPSFEALSEAGPFAGLAAELYRLLLSDAEGGLEVTLTKGRDGVRIETTPPLESNRLAGAKALAERHLADSPQGIRVSLRMDGASVAISSSSASTSRPQAPMKEPAFGYIPLEPEGPPDEEGGR